MSNETIAAMEKDLIEIVENTKVGVASGNIDHTDGTKITLLSCIATIMIDFLTEMETANELLSDILETKNGCDSVDTEK